MFEVVLTFFYAVFNPIIITDYAKTNTIFIIKDCNEEALVDAAKEICRMTDGGEQTNIEVKSVEEMKNLAIVCSQSVHLFNLKVTFTEMETYNEMLEKLLKILQHQKLNVSRF